MEYSDAWRFTYPCRRIRAKRSDLTASPALARGIEVVPFGFLDAGIGPVHPILVRDLEPEDQRDHKRREDDGDDHESDNHAYEGVEHPAQEQADDKSGNEPVGCPAHALQGCHHSGLHRAASLLLPSSLSFRPPSDNPATELPPAVL